MKNKNTETSGAVDKKEPFAETVVFILCLIVIVLRATFPEAPTTQPAQIQAAIHDTVYSLCLSGALIFAFLFWVLYNIWTGKRPHRPAAMAAGLLIFVLGAVIAGVNASNKRAAINASITIIAPMLMTVMLAGLLNSQHRIRILLAVIAALGVVMAWQSSEQYFVSNAVMLQKYNDDPNEILKPLGIQSGSFNHMLLEHRIKSKDVRAFFTTGNSAGSFAILTCFSTLAFLADRLKQRKTMPVPSGNITAGFFILAAAFFSLFITRSKGAVAAFFVSVLIFTILVYSRRQRQLKNIILALGFAGTIIAAVFVGWYGMNYGRLPGGNSMLVRWQYWKASAQMFFDHSLTGVGPGNFQWAYTHYKDAAALETVSDPHCFALSILAQYGFLGLAGFLFFLLTPLFKTNLALPEAPGTVGGKQFGKSAAICGFAVAAVVIAVRPFVVPAGTAEFIDTKIYLLFNDYIAPAIGFMVGFGVLIKALQTTRENEYALQHTGLTTTALFCGLFGFLIHNLIDFAIFEPGVLTTFCAVLGCLTAAGVGRIGQTEAKRTPVWFNLAATAGAFIICLGYLYFGIKPVVSSTGKIIEAERAVGKSQLNLAHGLLILATDDDRLSPDAPSKNGRLYLQHISIPLKKEEENLSRAEEALLTAIERNPSDYKNYEALGDVFSSRSQVEPAEKEQWLDKATFFISLAADLYPGNADLHFRLGEITDELGRTDEAVEHYKRAVEIEDDYRKMFMIMYPGRDVFSRLPQEKYLVARKRIKILSQKPVL